MRSLPRTPGLFYASDVDGSRLPIIDLTHPAFAVRLSAADLEQWFAAHREKERRRAGTPRWLQWLLFRLFARSSYFGRQLAKAKGGYLDAMSTYRFKLGPDQLDPSWALPFDQRIAASLPALCMRLRLQDMAELIADDLETRLAAAPARPLYFGNIAGGPCMDNLNALLLLRRRAPQLLQGRQVRIEVFDQESAGPAFAWRALEVWRQPGGPLHGVDITFAHTTYRWNDAKHLADELKRCPREVVAAVSSEGGLFDYGSDEEIAANLAAVRDVLPADTTVTGSFTPPKPADTPAPVGPRFAIRERDVNALGAVARGAGWEIARAIPRPFQTTCLLRRANVSQEPLERR